jgi:hypothetical protein
MSAEWLRRNPGENTAITISVMTISAMADTVSILAEAEPRRVHCHHYISDDDISDDDISDG